MVAETTNCFAVATGGVGESGAFSQLIYQVPGKGVNFVVLKTTESSLCPNTGAVGVIVVNGTPETVGDLTKPGSLLKVNVKPNDSVVAIISTVPLFNDIHCIRLGELCVTLSACD